MFKLAYRRLEEVNDDKEVSLRATLAIAAFSKLRKAYMLGCEGVGIEGRLLAYIASTR